MKYNIFIANEIYPNSSEIFTNKIKSVEEIIEDSIIVLDTNALLLPYTISKNSVEQIKDTYRKLVSGKRLVVPGQVAREFAKNRPNKIAELHQQLKRKMDKSLQLNQGSYPLLESLSVYQDAIRIEQDMESLLVQYKGKLKQVLKHIKNWNWDDPISELYREVFNQDVFLELSISEEDLIKDLERRLAHSIPPGYKDSNKEDKGIGDLAIWHAILEIGKSAKSNVLFVSGEEKADWWHRSENQTLYPRYELVYEFHTASDGHSFQIIKLSQLLDLFGANACIVEEIREEEKLKVQEGLSVDNVQDLLDEIFPGRSKSKRIELEELVSSMKKAGYRNVGEVKKAVNRGMTALNKYEEDNPPPGGRFYQIGAIRILLRIVDENYNAIDGGIPSHIESARRFVDN